jgi:hypothetical protein
MTASKVLPDRPSLDSLRKQAKKLAHDIAAGDGTAIARAELGTHVNRGARRLSFIKYFIETRPAHAPAVGPWKAFVMGRPGS